MNCDASCQRSDFVETSLCYAVLYSVEKNIEVKVIEAIDNVIFRMPRKIPTPLDKWHNANPIDVTTERDSGEDAGAAVSDEQMRFPFPRYPVDRYLVESSKTMDMDKLIDDLWKPEPALRLEDEIMLRELHGMLQSTADDLRMLSAELSKYHEPRVQVKTIPTPLDEDYNEQMHIEEIVDAKFHGLKPSSSHSTVTPQNIPKIVQEIVAKKIKNSKPVIDSIIEEPVKEVQKKPVKKLSISRTKTIQIVEARKETSNDNSNSIKSTEVTQPLKKSKEDRTVYKEIVHEYEQPKEETLVTNAFNIQKMPSINIRSELKTQNVLQLDILPENKDICTNSEDKNNVAVISVIHELPSTSKKDIHEKNLTLDQPPVRKVFKMASYETSESSNNNTIEDKHAVSNYKTTHKVLDRRKDPKLQISNNNDFSKKDSKRPRSNLNEWKKKLNTIYGQSSKSVKSSSKNINAMSNNNTAQTSIHPPSKTSINNTEYIPYTKLTLGGVKVKDIEREISNVSKNRDVPLSPILDKILSRQNSFSNDKSPKHKNGDEKFLSTSDENLLQEVLDIEEKIISTISKNKNSNNTLSPRKVSDNDADNTYADDFEIDNSEPPSAKSESESPQDSVNFNMNDINDHTMIEPTQSNENNNTTYVKVSNLSFKNHIDTFEFIHTIDRQDNATQSNTINKISLKETQTSPRNDNDNIQTIRNDLSLDPKHEIENMFKIEKDFIKKLIIEEYSDLIEKNVNKPSTSYDSKTYSDEKNISTIQKNTQTSPARVKNVMTSPTQTKTRTTSPFALSLTVHKQTSPMIVITNEEKDLVDEIQPLESKVTIDQEDHNITINLSSPRFSLRLPQSSCDLSNEDRHPKNNRTVKPKYRVPSSSSSKEDYTSSDISFGEIKREFKRKLRRHKIPSISEPSSSSLSKYSEHSSIVAPLRSEGELSVCPTRSNNKYSRSEGEISLGQIRKH